MSNNCRELKNVILCVKNCHTCAFDHVVSWVLIGFLHQVDNFRIEVVPKWRLIHDYVANSLHSHSAEEVSSLRVEKKVSASMVKQRPGS